MAVCYDTGILLAIARDPSKAENIRNLVNPDKEIEFISIVSSAELRSLAAQNRWGRTKTQNIDALLGDINIVNIDSDLLVDRYVEIDVFSQRKGERPLNDSPRNMGKNDLWIAATASLLDLRLITTDGDYGHLNSEYLTRDYYPPQQLTKS